jgi:hypothetical protein
MSDGVGDTTANHQHRSAAMAVAATTTARRITADKEAGDDERWRRQRDNHPANKG